MRGALEAIHHALLMPCAVSNGRFCVCSDSLPEAMAIASGLGVLSTVAVPMQRALRKQADANGAKAREVSNPRSHILRPAQLL